MPARPNLLFIIADQLRHDFLGCYGAPFIATPNIDRIAREGVLYEQAYSPHPVCVSARVALLTGLDAVKTGVTNNGQFLRPDHAEAGLPTWPLMLSAAGYFTSAIGKMHFYPWDEAFGFDHRVICEDKRWLLIQDDYFHFLARRGHRKYHGNEHEGYYENRGAVVSLLPWECYWDRFVGREAAAFLRTCDSRPFAAMVSFPGPHCPYDPTPEYLAQFDEADMPAAVPEVEGDHPELRRLNVEGNKLPWNGVDYSEFTETHKRRIRAHYAAMVKQIDGQVGEILAVLEENGTLDDTLVLFTSDHGDSLGDHNLIGKGTFFESSCHIPLVVRPPRGSGWGSRLPPASRCGDLVSLTDVTSTLLAFAGIDPPGYMDSLPLPGLGLPTPRRDVLIGMLGSAWMAYDGRTRLAKYSTGESLMFDLAEDPGEQRDLLKRGEGGDLFRELDAAITSQIMRSIEFGHLDKQVYVSDMSADPRFGARGWRRRFPKPLGEEMRKAGYAG